MMLVNLAHLQHMRAAKDIMVDQALSHLDTRETLRQTVTWQQACSRQLVDVGELGGLQGEHHTTRLMQVAMTQLLMKTMR